MTSGFRPRRTPRLPSGIVGTMRLTPGVLLQDGERRIVRVDNCPAGRARHRPGVAQRTQFDRRAAVLAVESSVSCDGRSLVERPDVAKGQGVVLDELRR